MGMGNGPGKYDSALTMAKQSVDASEGVLIILDGNKGSGFSVQASEETILKLPTILESMSSQIRAQTDDSVPSENDSEAKIKSLESKLEWLLNHVGIDERGLYLPSANGKLDPEISRKYLEALIAKGM
jgi:hypothetical protein